MNLRTSLAGVLVLAACRVATRPSGLPTDRAQVKEEIQLAYEALKSDWDRHQDEAIAGQRRSELEGSPREQWPTADVARYFPRFEALADLGHPWAIDWCIWAWDHLGAGGVRWWTDDLLHRSYRRLVEDHPDHPATGNAFRKLHTHALVDDVMGIDRAIALCEEARRRSRNPAIRLQALTQEAKLSAMRDSPHGTGQARALYGDLIREFPDTYEAEAARDELLHLGPLSAGNVAPDFEALDTEGVAFRLSDYRGKVVVLDFWGFW